MILSGFVNMTQYRSSGAKPMTISHVKSEGTFLKFWALPQSSAEILRDIESHFFRISDDLEPISGFIRNNQNPIGLKCAVKSKTRQKWCRARILATYGVNEILVLLIDYGNEETISVADARKVDEYFFRHPPLAVECILADVEPYYGVEWTPEAVRFCEHHLVGETSSCFAVSEHMKTPVVRVAKQGESQPFVQRLINSNLARIKDENRQLSYKINTLKPNSPPHLVRVSYIETPKKFFVQLISAEMELKNMMHALQKYAETEQLQFVNAPYLNMPCLTRASSKSCYYRSSITGIQNGCFKVLFVDYGYSEVKEFQELKVLPPRFFELAAQAICCSLHGDVDGNHFARATDNKQFTCHVLDRVGDIHIVNLQEQARELISASSAQAIQPILYKQQKLVLKQSYEVTISSINDISEFYCQMVIIQDQLNKMSQILNSGLEFLPLSLAECQLGMPVCVKFSDDNKWYRAQIIKINNESDIEVFFVDYGNYDNANLKDVCKMIPDLMKFPTQAFKCSLYDVALPNDQSMNDEMFDIFEELTSGQNMTAHVKGILEDMKYDVILLEKNGKVSINDKLESSALIVGTVPVSDVENLFVTHFEAPDSFFAQFEKLDSNKLSQMQDEVNEYYSNAKNSHFRPKVKNLVCAKFLVDDQFYRARVEAVMDSACEVSFIDYGNKEQVSLEDIHPMNKKFTQYPQFGITCALEKFPAATPVEKLSGLMVDNPIQAKMLKDLNGKWYISLTENFANNVPILELLRQHELVVPRSIHGAGLGGFQSNVSKEDSYYSKETVKKSSWQESSESERKDVRKEQFEKPFVTGDDSNMKTKSVTSLLDYDSKVIPSNAYRNVYVSHVISPSEFYCQIEEENSKLLSLMKDIENAYANVNDNELNFKDFTVNAPCCAIFEDDGAWYRGKIQKINHTSCEVFFVDYGNVSTVPKSKIKVLLGNLLAMPVQAFRCKSYNVSPKVGSWNDTAIDAFIDMTLDKSFVAQFVERDNNDTYSVNLVNIGKLQEDVLSKEFVKLGHGRLEDSNKILVLNSHAASSNLSFSHLNINLNLSEAVEVTYGLNPCEIYCQLKSKSADFKTMMEKLQNYYSKISDHESLIDRPHSGMICVAQFFQDSAWYRAIIKKVEKSSILVFYVDYGNSETVDKKNIRCIIQDFTIFPIQAIKCHLKGIKPPSKSWKINNSISKYYEGDTWCKFLLKENDYYVVEMTCNKKNVASQLVQDSLAIADDLVPEEPKDNFDLKPDSQICQSVVLPNRELNFERNQLLSVVVSYVENTSKFYCQLLDESDILDNLMAEIEAAYQEPNIPFVNLASLTVNGYCMAKYSEDQAWYRARVGSISSQGDCEVFFIDYGNSEAVSASQVASILPEFAKLPPQCFECKLQNAPSISDVTKTRSFQDLVDEAEELTATILSIDNNICSVMLLYDKDNDEVNISEVLFGENMGNVSPSCEFIKFLPPDIPLGLHDGYVSTVNTPQDFFIQLASCEEALTAFSTELAESCEKMEPDDSIVMHPAVSLACCAKYSEDDNWYRAEILSLQENSADVLFVDYGNLENVPLHSLKVLSDKFLTVPPYAVKCKLNGIVPIKEPWTSDVINTFQEIVDDCLLGITFISKDTPAIVNLTKDDKDVAQTLVDMELANVDTCTETGEAYVEDHLTAPIEDQPCSLTNDQSYPRRKFNVSSKVIAKICYVDSYDRFFITPVELNIELDSVMSSLKMTYDANKSGQPSLIFESLEDVRPSMACVAKYSQDEEWYRALITEIDGDNICVTFIDYGNSEICSLDNLRQITNVHSDIRPAAVECSLFGIQAIEGKEQEITTKLEEFYLDEVELEMEVHESNPLKVKLYHNGIDIVADLINEGLAIAVEFSKESEVQMDSQTLNNSCLSSNIIVPPFVFVDLEMNSVSIKFYEIENNVVVLYAVPMVLNEELENFQAHLNDVYSEMERTPLKLVNMAFCVAKYSEDESWYRAQILLCDNENIKVKFIDFGNSENVNVNDINILIPEFALKPQFSAKCVLSCYKVIDSKQDELCSTLDDCIYNGSVQLKLCESSHNVPGICINSVLCEEKDILKTMLSDELVSVQFVMNYDIENTFVGTVEKVEGDIFYTIPIDFKKVRENLQIQLQNVCTFDSNQSEIDQKIFYAVHKSDHWYRAVLISLNVDTAIVKLIDFEDTVEVQISHLIPLPSLFYHQPLLLLPCKFESLESRKDNFKVQFALDLVNYAIPITCSLLDPTAKGFPLIVTLSIDDIICQIVDIDENNDCIGKSFSLEENIAKEDVPNVIADCVNQEVEIDNETDSEIVFENKLKSEEIEVEVKALLNNSLEEETKMITNNFDDLSAEESRPNAVTPLNSDIVGGKASELEASSIDNEKNVEFDAVEQNDMFGNTGKLEELCPLGSITENIEQNVDSKNTYIPACAEETDTLNFSGEDEGSLNRDANFKSLADYNEGTKTSYADEKEIENTNSDNVSLYNDVIGDNLEIESPEANFQTVEHIKSNTSPETIAEFSQLEVSITNCTYTNSENIHSDNFEFKGKLEENFQFLSEKASLDNKLGIDDVKSENTIVSQMLKCSELNSTGEVECNENIANKISPIECIIGKVLDVSNKTDENAAVYDNENEKMKSDGPPSSAESDLESVKSENREVVNQNVNNCAEPNLSFQIEPENQITDTEDMADSELLNKSPIQDADCCIFSDDMYESGDELDNMEFNDTENVPSELSENNSIEVKTLDYDCQRNNSPILCSDTSHLKTSEIIPESTDYLENTNNSIGAKSEFNGEKERTEISTLQAETVDGLEIKNIELNDNWRSHAIQPSELETNSGNVNAMLNQLLNTRHISGKISAILSEISISDNSVMLAVTPTDLLDELSQFSESLQSTYSLEDASSLENCSVSHLCALFSETLWYRAIILDLSDNNVTALLIDNGLCIDTDVTKIRILDPKHVNIPPFSVWCTLASASCLDVKTDEVKNYLQTVAKDKVTEINIVEEEAYKISMSVDGANVLNELLKKNWVIQTLPLNSAKEGDHSAIMSHCHVSDTDIKMFINLSVELESFENLKKHMQDSYNAEAFEVPVNESSICAVYYKDMWFRAKVLSSDTKPYAKLIDVGEFIYDVQNFYSLLPEHCLYSPFAIPCLVSLTHSIDAEASKALKNLLGSAKFIVKLEMLSETQTVSAIIVDKDLIEKGKQFGVCFEQSTATYAEKIVNTDNEKQDCIKLTCKELDIEIDTLNATGNLDSTKQYAALLNESFSSDSSTD